ncbi:MAG: hypothetical protein IRY87_21190 [Acetobacteraceae bacterium]|nr:hypothetical protein [Acetobacteraceae bacterium]
MSGSSETLSFKITPMHRDEEGIWSSGPREGARFFMLEIVRGDGEDAEVVVECRDERSAALAARVLRATIGALGLVEGEERPEVEPFDEETVAILEANPTPEIVDPGEETEEPEE